jgi:hypothetical protein
MARRFSSNTTTPNTKFITSDGRRFDTPSEANAKQLEIDFELWYADPENRFTGNPNNAKNVLDWLTAHQTDIREILK